MKKATPLLAIAAAALVGCSSVEPGSEGFLFRPYGNGVDTSLYYSEGTFSVAPWNDLISYDMRQRTTDIDLSVMDVDGMPVEIKLSVLSKIMAHQSGWIHLKHGPEYEKNLIIAQAEAICRDVVGSFKAEELYSSKRGELQLLIDSALSEELTRYKLIVDDVLIRDVDLPEEITKAITDKMEQEQRNFLAQKKESEQIFLARAKVAEARGDSAQRVINAEAEARSIELKQSQLSKSHEYVEYVKWSTWDGTFGTGNVFGADVNLFRNQASK